MCCCCCCCWCRRTTGSNQLCLAEHTQRNQCDMMTCSLWCVTSFGLERSHVSLLRSPLVSLCIASLQQCPPHFPGLLLCYCPFPVVCYLLDEPVDANRSAVSDNCQQDSPHFHLLGLNCGIYLVLPHHWGQKVLSLSDKQHLHIWVPRRFILIYFELIQTALRFEIIKLNIVTKVAGW